MSAYDCLELSEEHERIFRELVPLPDTSQLEERMAEDRLAGRLTNVFEQRLVSARERDEIQRTRPEGCWCLGVGGKSLHLTRSNVMVLKTHCGCTDGQARRVFDAERVAKARQQRAASLAELFVESQLPPHFQNLDLSTYPTSTSAQRSVLAKLRAWIADSDRKPWLLISGPFGVGKTALSGGVVVELLKGQHFGADVAAEARIIVVAEMLDRLRPTTRYDANLMGELYDADVVVLDDIGAEKSSEWTEEKLFMLLDRRYRDELLTIFTTNYQRADLAERIGERSAWRILELAEHVSLRGCPNLRVPKRLQIVEKGA